MRAVIQRVLRASVISRVGEPNETRGGIDRGLVVLIGFTAGDEAGVEAWAADRIAGLRIFEDDAGRMNLDVRAIGGGVVAVPNFTLVADPAKGRRPGLSDAMPPAEAAKRFDAFVAELRRLLGPQALAASGDAEVVEASVAAGVFGSHMRVDLSNDGPVTMVLEA
jgi:D-tyrosyl-tRNA(Tyr) deacylase